MWNRAWNIGVIRPTYDATDQDQEANILKGWTSSIYTLPGRLLTALEVQSVEQIHAGGKACRIYPPFRLNEDKSMEGNFVDIAIPVG